jgi:hypothetical protein
VPLHGAGAEKQLRGDLLIRAPAGDQPEHLEFARAKAQRCRRPRLPPRRVPKAPRPPCATRAPRPAPDRALPAPPRAPGAHERPHTGPHSYRTGRSHPQAGAGHPQAPLTRRQDSARERRRGSHRRCADALRDRRQLVSRGARCCSVTGPDGRPCEELQASAQQVLLIASGSSSSPPTAAAVPSSSKRIPV